MGFHTKHSKIRKKMQKNREIIICQKDEKLLASTVLEYFNGFALKGAKVKNFQITLILASLIAFFSIFKFCWFTN